MKYIKIKKDKTAQALTHIMVLFPDVTQDQLMSISKRAFGVNNVDKCPITKKNRVHLLGEDEFDVFAWVFEDFTESI